MTRTLLRWGFAPELRQYAHKCGLLVFRNGAYPKFLDRVRVAYSFDLQAFRTN